jgi:hypothetical protein
MMDSTHCCTAARANSEQDQSRRSPPAQTGDTLSMTSIRQLIQSSPARSNELFAKLLDTSDGAVKTRQRLLEDLKQELDLLAQLEEQHLFPVLRKHKEMKELVRDAMNDNRQTKRLLADLEETPVDSEEFTKKASELRRVFQQHVRDDRKELLPAIVKVLTDEEAQAVVETIEAERTEIEETRRAETEQRRAGARQARETAEPATRATRQAAEAAQANTDTVLSAAGETTTTIQDSSERVARAFGLVAQETGEVVQRASSEMGALVQSGEAMRSGLSQLSREWVDLVQARLQANFDDMVALARSRTLPELITAQGNLVRHNMEMMVHNAQRLLRRSMRIGDAAKEPLADNERQSGRA